MALGAHMRPYSYIYCATHRDGVLQEELENPKLLDEPIDKENFIDIMCNNYLDDQIISKLYQTNLVNKFLDKEVINQFII